MSRYGRLCSHRSGRCDVTAGNPLFIACPACDGPGSTCHRCNGTGELAFTTCPRATIPAVAVAAVRYEEFSRRGVLPVGGGLLDQTAAGVDALQHVADEAMAWRAKLGLRDGNSW